MVTTLVIGAKSRNRSNGTVFITATLLVCDENSVPSV